MKAALLTLLFTVACISCAGALPQAPSAAIDDRGSEHPADHIDAARYLPHSVALVAVTDDPADLLERMGRSEIMQRFRTEYEQAAFELVREVGYNILSPEALSDLGIDTHGQAGIALAMGRSPEPQVIAFFKLAHAERFKNLIYMLATGHVGRQRMSQHPESSGVAVGRGELAFAVADDVGFVVMGGNALVMARNMMSFEPEETLAQHRAFRVAMRGAAEGSDVRGYIDLRVGLYAQAALDPRWAGSTLEEAQADIERLRRATLEGARARGADADRIKEIDHRFASAIPRLRNGKFEQRIRSLFGGIGGGGFSVDVSPRGVDVAGHLDLASGSLLQKLVRSRTGAPPLVSGLADVPAAMVGLSLDLPSVVELARQLDAPIAEANILLGGDIERDLLPLLDGELAAFVAPPPGGLTAVRDAKTVTFGVRIGVQNAKKVDEILTSFTDRGEGSSVLKRAGARRWSLTIASVAPLHVELSDTFLVVTTDAGFAKRLAHPSKGPTRGVKAWQLAAGKGGGAELYLQLAALFAADYVGASIKPQEVKRPPWHDPRWTPSAAYQAKLDELNALEAAIAKLDDARRVRRRAAEVEGATSLGAVGLSVRTTAHGISLLGSYRTTGRSVASVVASLVNSQRRANAPHEDDARRVELGETKKRLQAELDAIYEAEHPTSQDPPKPTKQP